jgi:uncharacterized protein (TIGR02145 family)
MKYFQVAYLIVFFSLIIIYSCEDNEENQAPTCYITSLYNGEEIEKGQTVTISVEAKDSDGNVTEVRFYMDGSGIGYSNSFPYNYEWNTAGEETGSHIIKVTAKDNNGSSAIDEIAVFLTEAGSSGIEPLAAFTASQTSIIPGAYIQFIDQSTNSPTSWVWDFGNDSISTEQNPSHTYTTAGTYTVNLTVTNEYGTDTETKADLITVTENSSGENNILFNSDLTYGTLTDIQGNTYKSIVIGEQEWMAQNLATTKFNDGTAIPNETSNSAWEALSTPAYCWYNNDEATYKADNGAIYNWYVVETGNLCPTDWHVPDENEWMDLIDFLGGADLAAIKLMEAGLIHWTNTNLNSTNESGFTALPSGQRWDDAGWFDEMSISGHWWTSDTIHYDYYSGDGSAPSIHIYSDNSTIEINQYPIKIGHSVRCIKD